jgi:hypothetical protein
VHNGKFIIVSNPPKIETDCSQEVSQVIQVINHRQEPPSPFAAYQKNDEKN